MSRQLDAVNMTQPSGYQGVIHAGDGEVPGVSPGKAPVPQISPHQDRHV